MRKLCVFIVLSMSYFVLSAQSRYLHKLPVHATANLHTAAAFYTEMPGLPSPFVTEQGREMILIKTQSNVFCWLDGTVENGQPFNYKKRLFGKGMQLQTAEKDFPHFAKTGIHTEKELGNAKLINGRSVAQITVDARPWASSGVGFVAGDETIISVIYGDNRMVKNLGLTHPDMARPLFHFWNISRNFDSLEENKKVKSMIYNGHEVEFEIRGSRGWQESIFNDEILGTGHIELWRELTNEELDFLAQNYVHLHPEHFEKLKRELSCIHTGEMVLFYINRYGFYEGHNEYRVDPVSVAMVFGLRSLEDVHRAAGGDLYTYFTSHYTFNPE